MKLKKTRKFLEAVRKGGDIKKLRPRLGIIHKETGEFIGWCCTGMKDELPDPNREIVYAISKDYRGKGFTTQATQGLIGYLFQNTDVEILNAVALLGNIPSNRVIQKCCFDHQDMIEIDKEQYNHYILTKNKWEKYIN